MIISKTPYRLSFFGGGTDFPKWYLKEEGAVLSTTIDKYCYLTCRFLPPYFQTRHRVVWSHIETVSTISEILHPAVREGLKMVGFDDTRGFEIHHQGDVPARSGMGTSSTFAVGLLNALYQLKGRTLSKAELADRAIHLEQERLAESVGSQDQVAAAYGGFNTIQFLKSGEIRVDPVQVATHRLTELQNHLMLVYTGSSRNGTELAKTTIANISKSKLVLRQMRAMVDKGREILEGHDPIHQFGKLLHQAWELKQALNPLSASSEINSIYKTALKQGAIGGKVMGSGGAGFVVLFVPPNRQRQLAAALQGYLHVPFKFESSGSTILLNSEPGIKAVKSNPIVDELNPSSKISI